MSENQSKKADVVKVYWEIDELWQETASCQSVSGRKAHETLFTNGGLQSRLLELETLLPEFRSQFLGTVTTIHDFAVQSGHEALAFFASRLAQFVKVRRKWIPVYEEKVAAAKQHGDPRIVTRNEDDLRHASEDFAKIIQDALRGWFEHRPWILRSIEKELRQSANAAAHAATTSAAAGGGSGAATARWRIARTSWGKAWPVASLRSGQRFLGRLPDLTPEHAAARDVERITAQELVDASNALLPFLREHHLDVIPVRELVRLLSGPLTLLQVTKLGGTMLQPEALDFARKVEFLVDELSALSPLIPPTEHNLKPLGRTEKWILAVLKQEPGRGFQIKELLAARHWKKQASCPVGRSALCDSLKGLRDHDAVAYVKRRYMHKA